MTVVTSRARLLNNDHELIAEGICDLDESAGQASLEVDRTTGAVQKQRGNLSLELDSGRSLLVSDKPILLTITPPGKKPTQENRRRIYRLRLVDPMAAIKEAEANSTDGSPASGPEIAQAVPSANRAGAAVAKDLVQEEGSGLGSSYVAQDASAAGAVSKGRLAASVVGRLSAQGRGETPAAR